MENDPTINEELEALSPLLSKQTKEEGYKVPYQYFEVLPDQIMAQVNPPEKEQAQVKPPAQWSFFDWIGQWKASSLTMAMASVLMVVVAGWLFLNQGGTPDGHTDQLAAAITANDAASYIASNLEDFDIDMLAEGMNTKQKEPVFPDIDKADLEQYIEDELLEDFDDTALEDLL